MQLFLFVVSLISISLVASLKSTSSEKLQAPEFCSPTSLLQSLLGVLGQIAPSPVEGGGNGNGMVQIANELKIKFLSFC